MRRSELEHAIRAATEIIRQEAVFIIGSQAILGSFTEDELPAEAMLSEEVDIAPLKDDDAQSVATELDAAIGEMSQFHETHGFYVQGVGQDTAVLPAGWTDRLVKVKNASTNDRTGLCLEPHDLCVAKLIAGRMKDHLFVGNSSGSTVDPVMAWNPHLKFYNDNRGYVNTKITKDALK